MSEFDEEGFADTKETIENTNENIKETIEKEEEIIELKREEFEKDLNKALEVKEEGNNYFRQKNYLEALNKYSQAIELCPEDIEHYEQRSIFYGNRAACYSSLNEHDLVIADCTSSLELNNNYIKVLVRRSQSYEVLEKYDEALADMKRVIELDPSYPRGQDIINRLQKKSDEKLEKMKTEAFGKLKELGNSILGNFGMSLDNFKMEQDKTTGSWSISMNK